MRVHVAFFFTYMSFKNEIGSVPYIYFIRNFEAPVTYHRQFICISSFPKNKCNSTGSICPHVWEGRFHVVLDYLSGLFFPIYCLEYFTFCQSHYFSEKRLFSAHCLTIAALWKHPRSLCSQLSYPKSVTLAW